MKKRSNIAKLMDSISAIIETVLFACVPVVFCDSLPYQITSYGILLLCQLVYICILRKRIIDRIVSPDGVDTDLLLDTNCVDTIRKKIVAQVQEIHSSTVSGEFDEYVVFLKWKEVSSYIVQHFRDNRLDNVVREDNVRYSKNKVYKKELLQIVGVLIDTYKRYTNFERAIALYRCKTLASDIQKVANELEMIKVNLEK